jgi:hypothetical protein
MRTRALGTNRARDAGLRKTVATVSLATASYASSPALGRLACDELSLRI